MAVTVGVAVSPSEAAALVVQVTLKGLVFLFEHVATA